MIQAYIQTIEPHHKYNSHIQLHSTKNPIAIEQKKPALKSD